MRAVLRRTRYSYLLAFHIILLCAAGRNLTDIAALAAEVGEKHL